MQVIPKHSVMKNCAGLCAHKRPSPERVKFITLVFISSIFCSSANF